MARSVVEIGMEILRAAQMDSESMDEMSPDDATEDSAEGEKEPTHMEVMQQLADQLTTLADRLAIRETVDMLAVQVTTLTRMVEQLAVLVSTPKIKVPIRDEAGRITEVREISAATEGY